VSLLSTMAGAKVARQAVLASSIGTLATLMMMMMILLRAEVPTVTRAAPGSHIRGERATISYRRPPSVLARKAERWPLAPGLLSTLALVAFAEVEPPSVLASRALRRQLASGGQEWQLALGLLSTMPPSVLAWRTGGQEWQLALGLLSTVPPSVLAWGTGGQEWQLALGLLSTITQAAKWRGTPPATTVERDTISC
jgi:hypothetical protein